MNPQNHSLNGLVLVGGSSRRMGKDKSTILYHKQPHAEYLVKVIQSFCSKAFISCRSDQKNLWKNQHILVDQNEDVGPIAGLLRAIQENNSTAWVVVGCDYPLVDKSVISLLVESRNLNADVSYLCSTSDSRPQPLLAIWEPSAFDQLKRNFEIGELSLTSCMSRLHTHAIPVEDGDLLLNANTPEEWDDARKLIKSRGSAKNQETW